MSRASTLTRYSASMMIIRRDWAFSSSPTELHLHSGSILWTFSTPPSGTSRFNVFTLPRYYDWTHGIDKKKREYVFLQVLCLLTKLLHEFLGYIFFITTGFRWYINGSKRSSKCHFFRWLLPSTDLIRNNVSSFL